MTGTIAALAVLTGGFALAAQAQAAFPGANGKIAFVSERDGNREIYVMNSDGSDQQNVTNHPGSDNDPSWSADGSMILFQSLARPGGDGVFMMSPNGSGLRRITTSVDHRQVQLAADGWRVVGWGLDRTDLYGTNLGSISWGTDPSWAPAGERIVFHANGVGLASINWDGSGQQTLTSDTRDNTPDWSPDGQSIIYRHADPDGGSGLYTVDSGGGVPARIPGSDEDDFLPGWSPDGSRITFMYDTGLNGDIYTADPDGSNRVRLTTDPAHDQSPAWQPLNPQPITGYPRPKGATPFRVSLVPAYTQCEAPNRTHGPSLAMPACSPPKQTSDYLTVGTPDYNGAAVQFVGSVQLDALPGNLATPGDEADVRLRASITDVRCKIAIYPCTGGSGSDYTGELQGNTSLRITDRDSYPIPLDSATVADVWVFPFTIPCAATANAGVGSSCSVDTTIDAITPNTIREGMRSVWELKQIEVRDGGADGENQTDDFTLFAVQGIFVP